jgi:2,5-diketo-D-gluconate reductase A
LEALLRTGKVRSIGTSNFKPSHLQRLFDAGLAPHVNQIQLDPEHVSADVRELHRQHDVVTAAYSPLGRGGSFLKDPAITAPAAKYRKTPSQIVLRWHTQQGIPTAAKSANPQRQRENMDIFDFKLTQLEVVRINSLDTGEPARLDSDTYAH